MYLFRAWMFRAWMWAGGLFRPTDRSSTYAAAMIEVWHTRPVFVEINGALAMSNYGYKTQFVVNQGCVIRALLPDGPPQEIGSYGTPITQADVASITVTITSDGDPVSGYDDLSLDPADVMLDTLQGVSDPRFDGANFVWTVPASAFPTANVMATILVTITSTDGSINWPIGISGPVREAT